MSAADSTGLFPSPPSRRTFLGLAASGAAATILGAVLPRDGALGVPSVLDAQTRLDIPGPLVNEPLADTEASEGLLRASRLLLPGTPWETPLTIPRGEAVGPTVLVLGGVHGDEPGAWMAAEEIAQWEPRAGTLLVVPRANVLAIAAEQRTLPSLGDLNRLYPGTTGTLPMSRMAAAIVSVAQAFDVGVVYDMHESWDFFVERPRGGNAFLGQTVTNGAGPEADTRRSRWWRR